ncbi:uncharacterized protein LOC113293707 isoform X2 [Papaver somniferum]|uniref:uncharacterized protein LOC113293707 isoform X2 n=2 Tax=Papaver somniferum TaxID=3469 RepID=UPI000E6FD75C|nr:uncharacterized protein LOC113293707 isoform X2 [Papaver somniferum]
MLPKIYRKDHYVYWSCGFGYLPATNEYKVVVLNTLMGGFDFMEVVVYTLGSGNGWRTVETLDIHLAKVYIEFERGVFVNGAVHWRDRLGGKVLAFDLTKEKFSGLLSPPPCPSILREPSGIGIGVFGGVLYYATSQRRWCDIWLLKKKTDIGDMEEQVEHEPLDWSKEFSLPCSPRIDEPLAFTKTGSVLYFSPRSIRIYDAVASTPKTLVDFTRLSLFNRIFPHKVTLLSLKELGEENVQVMQPAAIEEAGTLDLASKHLAR